MFIFKRPSTSAAYSSTFSGRLNIFLENITVHCYNHLVQYDRTGWERVMWLAVHFIFGTASIAIITTAWIEFNTNPLVTRLQDTLYPSANVHFPAVTICDVNRVSKQRALKLASELSKNDEKNRTIEYFLDKIKSFGALYDLGVDDEQGMRDFQNDIDNLFGISPTENSNNLTTVLMERLSPMCKDRLVRCLWRSKAYNCTSSEDRGKTVDGLFSRRRSSEYGHCCSFNYVALPGREVRDPRSAKFTGPDMGLIVLLNGSTDDNFLPIKSRKGFAVLIHNPYDYPQSQSGNVMEVSAAMGSETFVRVDGTTLRTERHLINYPTKDRKCRFENEMANKFGGTYSHSQCIVSCSMKSALALCGCVPFRLPVDLILSNTSQPFKTCNLHDIACIQRYKIKWLTISTEILDEPGLEREREESLYCPECFPSCSDTKYDVWSAGLPLHRSYRRGNNIMVGIDNVTHVGLLRVYFGQSQTWLFKQDVQLEWYELLSNFGGIFGVLLGFSMVSAAEIIYFIIKEIVLYLHSKLAVPELAENLVILP